jgi:heavy metal sensor kinase
LFRAKIALLSVLLAGSVFAGLGLYALSVMDRVGLARIDRELLTLGEGHLAVRPPRDYWQHFGRSLQFIYGEERSAELIVQVRDARHEVLFKSPHWPAEITDEAFPDFDRAMETKPPVSGGASGRDRAMEPRPGPAAAPPEHRPADRDRGARGERRTPPPEAYEACRGKSAGSVSRFVDARGETLEGLCEEELGRLVLRPDANRKGGPGRAEAAPEERPPSPAPALQDPEGVMPRIKKKALFATVETPSGAWRTGIMGSDRITIMVGMNLAGFYEDQARYRRAFLAVVPVALLLLAGGGWILARRALEPVSLITRTAEAVTARALDQRIPRIDGDRELSRLVEVINGMLDRLERSFGQAVRFSSDAAHELQTPLTILQGELDDAVQHAPAGSEEQQRYSALLEEAQRLKGIVQKLLILARADAGRLNLSFEPVDLSALVSSEAEDAGAMAPHLTIETGIEPGVTVQGDPGLLAQALGNLTSNAVKYNRSRGVIRFAVAAGRGLALVTVSNTGAPIPAEDRERIFERFYRVDPSRSKSVSGTGLGLSLAREIARAHGGDLGLDPACGDTISFTLSLPRSAG